MGHAALKLYEITDALQDVGDALMDNGGELTPELEALLDSLEGAFEHKAENVALFIRQLEVNGAAAATEAKRLTELAQQRERAATRLKSYLLENMQRTDHQKVETPRVKIRVQRNSRPSIHWMKDAEKLPVELKRVKVELDGEAAYKIWKTEPAALPDGFEVVLGSHLRIS